MCWARMLPSLTGRWNMPCVTVATCKGGTYVVLGRVLLQDINGSYCDPNLCALQYLIRCLFRTRGGLVDSWLSWLGVREGLRALGVNFE